MALLFLFNLFSERKIGPNEIESYGFACKENDIIGVCLEFNKGLANLSFYKNKIFCGMAFTNLCGPLLPAVTMFYGEVSVCLNPMASKPIWFVSLYIYKPGNPESTTLV